MHSSLWSMCRPLDHQVPPNGGSLTPKYQFDDPEPCVIFLFHFRLLLPLKWNVFALVSMNQELCSVGASVFNLGTLNE